MDALREAIYGALVTDPTLTGLLSDPEAIFHRTAPQSARYPLVIFHRQTASDRYAMSPDPLSSELWTVKAVARSGSSSAVDDVASRILVVLNDAPLALDDGALLYLRRDSQIDYGEVDGADQLHHVGGLYRAVVDRA